MAADGVDLYIWGNAETASSIVAACIPVLRVLVRDVHASTRQYYVSGKGADTACGSGGMHMGAATSGQPRAQYIIRMDNWSERSILDKLPEPAPNGGRGV